MACTITTAYIAGASPSTPRFSHTINVACDSAYVTGGYAMSLATRVGSGRTVVATNALGIVTSSGAPDTRHYQYNATTDKLVAMKADGSGECSSNTDLSTITVALNVESY